MSRDDDAQVTRLERAHSDLLATRRSGDDRAQRQARARFDAASRNATGPEKLRFLLRAPRTMRWHAPRTR